AGSEEPCARQIVSSLARRASRRPPTKEDVDVLFGFFKRGRAEASTSLGASGSFEHGIQLALERVLASPDFLFRIEQDPKTAVAGRPYRISDFELASRLSFFLWSSIPDDELLDAASRGQLRDPKGLERQVARML